jgi:dTDP-4-dehydrorhamnose 3,5-epimerase
MEIVPLAIPEVRLIRPRRFQDVRGHFAELYNQRTLGEALGLSGPLVQDNLSHSARSGTVRALHFQRPPNAQGKLVRVTRGAIRDVAVDLRRGSPTFGAHVMVELSERELALLWVPEGFAHGFVTTAPDTEVNYKVTAYYSPADEVGVQWDDPDLGIPWGVSAAEATLSDRDRRQTAFAALESPF